MIVVISPGVLAEARSSQTVRALTRVARDRISLPSARGPHPADQTGTPHQEGRGLPNDTLAYAMQLRDTAS
jgi:hypothetical protein